MLCLLHLQSENANNLTTCLGSRISIRAHSPSILFRSFTDNGRVVVRMQTMRKIGMFLVTLLNSSISLTCSFLQRGIRSITNRRIQLGANYLRELSNNSEVAAAHKYQRSRSLPPLHSRESRALPPLTTSETAKLASVFCFFWFIANWSQNASLDFTSVASCTILSSMSGEN